MSNEIDYGSKSHDQFLYLNVTETPFLIEMLLKTVGSLKSHSTSIMSLIKKINHSKLIFVYKSTQNKKYYSFILDPWICICICFWRSNFYKIISENILH